MGVIGMVDSPPEKDVPPSLLDRMAFGATVVLIAFSASTFGRDFTAAAYMFMGATSYASGLSLARTPQRTRWIALTSTVGFTLGLMSVA